MISSDQQLSTGSDYVGITTGLAEYIVTCKSYEDLENLYDDMETPGGSLYIPDRAVDLVHRRTISRNTHYMLTAAEAEEIRNDERVLACEINPTDMGLVAEPFWVQTGDFNKTSGSFAGDDKNWGLWRVITGQSYPVVTYNINVSNSGASAYTLSGSDRNGSVSGNNVTVTLKVGDTVNFVVNASGHPFYIRVSNGGANVSTPAATNQGTQSGTVSWTPNTAGTYYYQCGNHSGMIGIITVNAQTNDWGSDNSVEITNQEIITTASGKNVDVILVDSPVNPDHPEFAVNPDGTGGSRVIEFNWLQYNSVLGHGANGTYDYSQNTSNDHGTHVAGTVGGNTQGFARDANIYQMDFMDGAAGKTNWATMLWDYIRHFHKNKPINPATGRRNPTITNHSWGYNYLYAFTFDSVFSVTTRGNTTILSGTLAERKAAIEAAGIPGYAGLGQGVNPAPARYYAIEEDIKDMMDDGVIMIGAAGNNAYPIDLPSGLDYDNSYFVLNVGSYLSHRGSTPTAVDGCICVGSIGSKTTENKSYFSNWGPRVDIWAPGSDIISAVYDNTSPFFSYLPIVADSRNSSYYLASIDGTSMACPHVTGVIACLLETEPNLTQAEALQYLKEHSLAEVGDPGGNPSSVDTGYEALGSNSNNRYLFIERKREVTGSLQQTRFKNRNPDTAGVKYPRTNNSVHK